MDEYDSRHFERCFHIPLLQQKAGDGLESAAQEGASEGRVQQKESANHLNVHFREIRNLPLILRIELANREPSSSG
jgi:hypothetical protein